MDYNTAPQSKETIQSLWRLEKIILESLDFNTTVQKIVDSVLVELGYLNLGYRIVVLALIDEEKKFLKRISISKTEEAEKALSLTPIPFYDINIPLTATQNICVRAVLENKFFTTSDWKNLLCPPYKPEEAVQVQNAVGIKNSMVFPVISKNNAIGILIFSMVKEPDKVSEDEMDLIKSFTEVVGLAVQNATLYSNLQKVTEQLKVANSRLQEIDRLKDEFVSLASHELRTPMTIIKSYLWMMLDKKNASALSEKQRMYVDRAYTSTQRLINLVNDMLNVSRIESGRFTLNMKPIDLGELIATVHTEMLPKAQEQKINLEFIKPSESLPKVQADPERVEQVLINLVGNSLKFTPENGTIKIELNFDPKEAKETVSITDNGKGIVAEDISKLFQKFSMVGNNYLVKQNAQGTGLGLYLSKSMIELMGGKIWAESEGLGKGSKFNFTLKTI